MGPYKDQVITAINRILFTGGTVFVLGAQPSGILAAVVGNTLPDALGYALGKKSRSSHDLLFWLVPLALVWMYADNEHLAVLSPQLASLLFLFAAGPLLHLVADLFTSEGIQMSGWRISFNLFKEGCFAEYGQLVPYLLILGGYRFHAADQVNLAGYISFGLDPQTTAAFVVAVALFLSSSIISLVARVFFQGSNRVGSLSIGKTVHITDVLRHQIEQQEENAAAFESHDEQGPLPMASVSFNDVILDKAWKDYVEPYADEIKRSGLYQVIREVFALFARIGHGVPSVFGQDMADKGKQMASSDDFKLLSQVSLVDHTLRVVGLCLGKVQEKRGKYWVFHWPDLLLASLAHDIAKAPLVMEGGYRSNAHPINSANYVGSLIRELSDEGKTERNETILDLIRNHHNTDERTWKFLGRILIKCDQEAREIEKDYARKGTLPVPPQGSFNPSQGSGYTPVLPAAPTTQPSPPPLFSGTPVIPSSMSAPMSAPLSVAPLLVEEVGEITRTVQIRRGGVPVQITARTIAVDFVQQVMELFLHTYLNVLVGGKGFWGVSQENRMIYCWTDRIYECIQAVAGDRKLSSPWYFDEEHRDSLLLSFYDVLREQGWADDTIGDKYYSNVFHFWNPGKQNETEVARQYSTGHYMVIKAAAFNMDWDEIEFKRQNNPTLKLITMKPGKYSGEGS